jgi:SAM-dependent methyltransferase
MRSTDTLARLVPDGLLDTVEAFKTTMLETDRRLKLDELCGLGAQELVNAACDSVADALREHDQCEVIGRYVVRETFPYFMLGDLNERAYRKPRGYAGAYATIEMLYTDRASGRGRLGPLIDRWTRELAAARAVKNRRALMAHAIDDVAGRWSGTSAVRVTSLAAGPARELFDVLATPVGTNVFATCIDIDQEALRYAAQRARQLGVANRFRFARDNVVRLCQDRGRTVLEPQALIYSIGLTDYLRDAHVVDLINWAYDRLLPGGTLIIGNVVPSNPTRTYMDHMLDWVLIHRSAEELRELFARSRFGTTPVCLRTEPAGVDLFAYCSKN